jgi:hypothetical protein
MLSTIARHNPDAMLEVCERVSNLADEAYWEVKTQCLEFAATILNQFRAHSHVLAVKDDFKSGANKPGTGAGQNSNSGSLNNKRETHADKTVIKNSMAVCTEIIRKCFNIMAPKSVQKLGLFKLQPLLNDFKLLYPAYVEVLI